MSNFIPPWKLQKLKVTQNILKHILVLEFFEIRYNFRISVKFGNCAQARNIAR